MISRYFPLEEYETRWQRADHALRAEGLDLALIWGRSAGTYDRCADLLYLANYYGNQPGQGRRGPAGFAAIVLRPGEAPELFADVHDPRPELVATKRIHACADAFEAVAKILAASPPSRIALVGSDVVPIKYWRALEASSTRHEWVIRDELVREIRLVKSDRELEAFRTAGAVATHALDSMTRSLLAGASEAEAAGEAARAVFRGGGHVHLLAISHGAYLKHLCTDPLSGFSPIRPAPGELVRGWVTGPMFQGYWLGPGRTVVSAVPPSVSQRALLEANAAAVQKVIAAIRDGVRVRELVEIGDRCAREFGGTTSELSRQWPLYGHGNGLFFEAPTISTQVGNDADFVLRSNMVVSIEMFFAQPGVGESGFENNVIVTADGSELLSRTPMLF